MMETTHLAKDYGYYCQWFESIDWLDEEEKYHELASMTENRKERILWLCCRLAGRDCHIYESDHDPG
jgi:hypothetical protein